MRLVIINTADYILFVKTADFVLRIVQRTNTKSGPHADMLNGRYI